MGKEIKGTVSYTGNKHFDYAKYADTVWFSGFLWGLIVMGIILDILIILY